MAIFEYYFAYTNICCTRGLNPSIEQFNENQQKGKSRQPKKTNGGNFDEQKYWMKKMLRRGRRCREEGEEDAEIEKNMPRRRGRRC